MLAEPVGANAYLTPPNSQGFDIHYDNHCALVLQLQGSKNWTVFAPMTELPVNRCEQPLVREELGSPLLTSTIAEGDVLYIPRGFPHFASTSKVTSLHLTVSIRPVTWADAIHAICLDDVTFRRSVDRLGGRRDVQATFESDLLPRLAVVKVKPYIERRLSESVAKMVPLPAGRLAAIHNQKVGLQTAVIRISEVICRVTAEGSEAVLRYPGASLRLPSAMKPVLEFIAKCDEFAVSELPEIEGEYDRCRLIEILIRRGLLRVGEGAGDTIQSEQQAVAEVR